MGVLGCGQGEVIGSTFSPNRGLCDLRPESSVPLCPLTHVSGMLSAVGYKLKQFGSAESERAIPQIFRPRVEKRLSVTKSAFVCIVGYCFDWSRQDS